MTPVPQEFAATPQRVVQIEGYSTLARGSLAMIMGGALIGAAVGVFRWRTSYSAEVTLGIAASVASGVGVTLVAYGIWCWLNPWTWTAIRYPEIWIARKECKL